MRLTLKDVIFSISLVCMILAFVITFRKTNELVSQAENRFVSSQAAQSFAFHAFRVHEKFTEAGVTFTLNKLDFEINDTGEKFILEFAYEIPDEIQDSEVRGKLNDWLSPLTRNCGIYNPRRDYNWSISKIEPDLIHASQANLRSGIIRVEKSPQWQK